MCAQEWTYSSEKQNIYNRLNTMYHKNQELAKKEEIKTLINDLKEDVKKKGEPFQLDHILTCIKIWLNTSYEIKYNLERSMFHINRVRREYFMKVDDLRKEGADSELGDKLQEEFEAFFGK